MSEPTRQKAGWGWAITASLLMLPPVVFIIHWVNVAKRVTTNQEDRVAEFLSSFPEFLQNATLLTFNAFVLATAAVIVAFKSLDHVKGPARIVSLLIFSGGGLVAIWLLFTLM